MSMSAEDQQFAKEVAEVEQWWKVSLTALRFNHLNLKLIKKLYYKF